MADRLQAAVEAYDPGLMHPRLGSLHLGVSVGYAYFPVDGQDCASLLSAADSRMFSDKTERKLGRLADPVRSRDSQQDPDDILELPAAA
jgi:GGDEF domain-containing protein